MISGKSILFLDSKTKTTQTLEMTTHTISTLNNGVLRQSKSDCIISSGLSYKLPHQHQNSDKFHQRYIAAMFVTIWPCSSGEYVYSWQLQSDDDDSISHVPFGLGGLTKYFMQNENKRLIQACVTHLIKRFNE